MNCFNEEIIQEYIDNELSEELRDNFDNHLESCNECNTKFEQQLEIANFVKQEINSLYKEDIIIPNINAISGNSTIANKSIMRKLIYIVSAASIIFATFFYINYKQEPSSSDIEIFITNDYYYDANKGIMDQDIQIVIIDSDNEITNY